MKIIGVAEGLVAGSVREERKLNRVPEKPKPGICKYCDGLIQKARRGVFASSIDEELDGACLHCLKLFGREDHADPFGLCAGVTSLSAEQCIERIESLQRDTWGMILKWGKFGTQSGAVVEIEPGDIVKINRAGLSMTSVSASEYCSQSRSKERFSVEIMIGPLPLVLWPHEIAPVSFLVIMDLKRAGEIDESFVAQEDECGYFKPNDKLRAEIYECFGRLTGVPQ